ncbi:hypothetical protein EVAR_59317_1 [Eumeta japonica]|uniref:Uncharacterized protein n=1 Tax=Eumeta variegata TaxID=151549 RepID=A0A4C1YAX2_EUMVA|nr:hypothetical protein EVAR_59317_1 [Eumeta japonica]
MRLTLLPSFHFRLRDLNFKFSTLTQCGLDPANDPKRQSDAGRSAAINLIYSQQGAYPASWIEFEYCTRAYSAPPQTEGAGVLAVSTCLQCYGEFSEEAFKLILAADFRYRSTCQIHHITTAIAEFARGHNLSPVCLPIQKPQATLPYAKFTFDITPASSICDLRSKLILAYSTDDREDGVEIIRRFCTRTII